MYAVKLRLVHKGMLFVALMLALELIFVSLLAFLLQDTQKQIAEDNRVREVISHIAALSDRSAEAAMKVLVVPSMIKAYLPPGREVPNDPNPFEGGFSESFAKLRGLCKGRPDELRQLKELERLCSHGTALVYSYRSLHFSRAERHLPERKKLLEISDSFASTGNEILESYDRLRAGDLAKRRETRQLLQAILIAGGLFNVLMAIGLVKVFSGAVTDRLKALAENAARFAGGEPLEPRMPGEDELSVVDAAFHDMAEAMSEIERKEQALVETAVDVICTLDRHYELTNVSPASLSLWGYRPDDLLGRQLTGLLPADEQERFRAQLAELKDRSAQAPFEMRLRHESGEYLDLLWSVRWSQKEQTFYCIGHDITARKRAERELKASEERIKTIIEHLPAGVVSVDQKGIVESVNPQAETILGFQAEGLAGVELSELIVVPSARTSQELLRRFRKLDAGTVLECAALRKGVEQVPIELTEERFDMGGSEHHLLIIQDIRQRLQVERLKQEFVSMISHDLKTPLMSVEASLSLLTVGACGELSSEAMAKLAESESDVSDVIRLTGGLLDIEKMKAGKLHQQLLPVVLLPVLEGVKASLELLSETSGTEVVIELLEEGKERAAEGDLSVFANRDLLQKALLVALSSALRVARPGNRVILQVEDQGAFVEVRIINGGSRAAGIAGGAATASASGGNFKVRAQSELGVAICKTLIEEQGGYARGEMSEDDWLMLAIKMRSADK